MFNDEDFEYFMVHPCCDKSKITVVELSPAVSYQRGEWDNVNDMTFHGEQGKKEAITYARKLAKKYSLVYCCFESRYGTGDEKLYLADEDVSDE